jgi:AraC-like DNA-binding protein
MYCMPFDFNLYSAILLPAVIQGFLFAGVSFKRYLNSDRLHELLLACLLLLLAIRVSYWMLGFAGWYDLHNGWTMFMFYFPFKATALAGPLLYFYFLSLTNAEFRFQKKHWPHAILPGIGMLMYLFKFNADFLFHYPFPELDINQYGCKGPWADIDNTSTVFLAAFFSFFGYSILTLRAYFAYRRYIREQFSSTEEIEFNWIRNVLVAVSLGVFILFTFEVLAYFQEGKTYMFTWYAYLGLGIVIYYISMEAMNAPSRWIQKLHFTPEDTTLPPTEQANSTAPPDDLSEWKEKLLLHLQTKQVFLDPELSLSDLATQLNTNTSLLSRVINTGFKQHFNDFINQYRVEAVIEQLKKDVHLRQTLISIAYDCGFNSKATFNRAFKKAKQMTPIEYIESL